ncbi:MAG: HEAT repeat domain-containing protein [Pirellulales bacterium]
MLDNAFEALNKYDWGQDPKVLKPIADAVVATHGDDAQRAELEGRLAAVLDTDATYDAKQFVCRKLVIVGTAASVPTVAKLLGDEKLSHMARYALERYDAPEAGAALRDALPKVDSPLKVGILSSLGSRGEAESVAVAGKYLADEDAAVATAAAKALGAIRTQAAADALGKAKPNDKARAAVTDASLACAEGVLAGGDKAAALAIYKRSAGEDQPKHVRLAATRGMLACAGS